MLFLQKFDKMLADTRQTQGEKLTMNYDTDLDEFKLKQFRIHELRDLARKIGVKSPTSQNKDELQQPPMCS